MIQVYVVCEGLTEFNFTNLVLEPHFRARDIYLRPSSLGRGRGGVSKYGEIKRHILMLARNRDFHVTTLLDYYAFPKGDLKARPTARDTVKRIAAVEEKFQQDIAHKNFIANLLAHEFEGLLFSCPGQFADIFWKKAANELTRIRKRFDTPEHINDSPQTAPSKRILSVCGSKYQKALHGPELAFSMGLDTIRRECPKFSAWMDAVERLGDGGRKGWAFHR